MNTKSSHRPSVTLVVGMHRSGTSLTAAALSRLGGTLSDDLQEGDESNERGYFESRAVVNLHDRILAALGSSWCTPKSVVPFPAEWWNAPEIIPLKSELTAIVREATANAKHWVSKDPRASRLLPLWNDVLVEALVDGGARVVATVSYASWIDDPVTTATRLTKALRFPKHARAHVASLIDGLVDCDLRHHDGDDASPVPFVDELFQAITSGGSKTLATMLERIASPVCITQR